VHQLDDLSWRRFLVLFQNLNPYGAVASRVDQILDDKHAEPEDDESGEAQANNFFSSMLTV